MLLARAFEVAQNATEASLRRDDVAEDLSRRRASWRRNRPRLADAFTELLGEQTRQSVDTLSAFARAVNWTDVAQAQSKLIAGSFLRFSQFNARYGAVPPPRDDCDSTLPRR